MSDQPQDQPADESAVNKYADKKTEPGETPPGMLPLVEPFFGPRAFLIAALPFVIYFIGTALGGHFEMTRKTEPAHRIRSMSRSLATSFREYANAEMLEEDAKAIFDRYGIDGVESALDDESSKVQVLVDKCKKLLTASDFEETPPTIRIQLDRLKKFVEQFLEIQAHWEDGELEEIRPKYIAFAEANDFEEPLKYNKSWYPTLYSIACVACCVALLFVMPNYLRKVPFRVSFFAISVGVIGVVLWIGLWWLNNEFGFGTANQRAAFNPFEELKATPVWMWTFLGIRLVGMVIAIPIAEEFFTRGFLMRYCEDIDWDQIPIGEATWRGWAGILVYAAFSHSEILAALVWFGMITWMYLKTKNIWDCVVAHAVTNGLLAAYVLATGTWILW